jgi:hypothetical protein
MNPHLAQARDFIAKGDSYYAAAALADASFAEWSTEELHDLLTALREERDRRARIAYAKRRARDAERHMDVHCPACGAPERTRCLDGTKRIEQSHPERAWKTRECPACGAKPGEWCMLPDAAERVYVTRVHEARVPRGGDR